MTRQDDGTEAGPGTGPAVAGDLTCAEAARWYLRAGLRPIPWVVRDGRKVCALAGFTYRDYRVTEADLAGWDPAWQVGLALGPHDQEADGVLLAWALDVDSAAELASWRDEHGMGVGLGPGWVQRSGRAGGGAHHLYLHAPGDPWPRHGALDPAFPHLEIISSGLLAVAPSVHPSGRRYAWDPVAGGGGGGGPGVAPPLLRQFLRERAAGGGGGGTAGRDAGGGTRPDLPALLRDGITAGAQDDVLKDVVYYGLYDGKSMEEVQLLWQAIAFRSPQDRADPWDGRYTPPGLRPPGHQRSDLERHADGARAKLRARGHTPVEAWMLDWVRSMQDVQRELAADVAAAEVAGAAGVDEVAAGAGGPGPAGEVPAEVERKIRAEQLRLRVREEARARERAIADEAAALARGVRREVEDGERFILAPAPAVTALWGRGNEVLWAEDEGLMVCGPQGIGKTVVVQNLLLARVGLAPRGWRLGGWPVAVDAGDDGVYLYLAMDRPAQARRSIARMVNGADPRVREVVRQRLRFWSGPLPVNVLSSPAVLADWAREACGGVAPRAIFCDSYKDLAVGLASDEVGAQLNLMVQEVVARGTQWVGAHHHRKSANEGAGGRPAPDRLDDVYGSTWLTSGLGSVVMVWGETGDEAVRLSQLKGPMGLVDPVQLVHDLRRGWVGVDGEVQADPLEVVGRWGAAGVTAQELAMALYDGDARALQVRARRLLARLQDEGLVRETAAVAEPGTGPGRPLARYRLAHWDLPGA